MYYIKGHKATLAVPWKMSMLSALAELVNVTQKNLTLPNQLNIPFPNPAWATLT